MADFALLPHPDQLEPAIDSVRVAVSRLDHGHLRASFQVVGDMNAIAWPGVACSGNGPWVHADELWHHSCFEIFSAVADDPSYLELNFATGGRWAAYAFCGPRSGMRPAAEVDLTAANWRIGPRRTELHLIVRVPVAYKSADWQLAFSTVIESKEGQKSYWALAHPSGPPDFHNRDCFIASLPAATAP